MPVIRIPDAIFERLQQHATPFVDSPAVVIERLLDAYESTTPVPKQSLRLPGQNRGETRLPESGEQASPELAQLPAGRETERESKDVYVNYGLYIDGWRRWEDARQYGFLCAGGGRKYSRPLFGLAPTDRLWVYVPGYGYVGVARVTGPVQRAAEFRVTTPGGEQRPIMEVLGGPYANDKIHINDPERCEYFVPVRWIQTRSLDEAVTDPDFFANPAIVCRPRSPRWCSTLERLRRDFPVNDQ